MKIFSQLSGGGSMVIIKTPDQTALMREAGRVVAKTLEMLEKAVKPGVTTWELDQIADDAIRSAGAIPSFKGYGGFPGSICTSVNEVVVHGIPSKECVLKEGDIISIDCGAILNGWHGDAAITCAVGNISPEAQALIDGTRESFMAMLPFAREGYRLGDISNAVQKAAEGRGYGVVRALCGHGIGQQMHEDPEVLNYGTPGRGIRLRRGMVLAVEPMLTMGTWQVKTLADDWTVVPLDGSLSAHYENTIAITDGAPEILTAL